MKQLSEEEKKIIEEDADAFYLNQTCRYWYLQAATTERLKANQEIEKLKAELKEQRFLHLEKNRVIADRELEVQSAEQRINELEGMLTKCQDGSPWYNEIGELLSKR
jgi:hypothetical protein